MLASESLLAAHFEKEPESATPSDSMTLVRRDGSVLRLPDYSKASGPVTLIEGDGYEIQGQALFPVHRKTADRILKLPRFAVTLRCGNRTVYHRRYVAGEATLTRAVTEAVDWLRPHRRTIRFSYIR